MEPDPLGTPTGLDPKDEIGTPPLASLSSWITLGLGQEPGVWMRRERRKFRSQGNFYIRSLNVYRVRWQLSGGFVDDIGD